MKNACLHVQSSAFRAVGRCSRVNTLVAAVRLFYRAIVNRTSYCACCMTSKICYVQQIVLDDFSHPCLNFFCPTLTRSPLVTRRFEHKIRPFCFSRLLRLRFPLKAVLQCSINMKQKRWRLWPIKVLVCYSSINQKAVKPFLHVFWTLERNSLWIIIIFSISPSARIRFRRFYNLLRCQQPWQWIHQ